MLGYDSLCSVAREHRLQTESVAVATPQEHALDVKFYHIHSHPYVQVEYNWVDQHHNTGLVLNDASLREDVERQQRIIRVLDQVSLNG